jgi:hypothetical protein
MSILNNYEVRLSQRYDFGCFYPLAVFQRDADGAIASYAQPLIMQSRPVAERHGVCDPTLLQLSRTQCQVLMDDLWAAGIRPTEGTGSAGSLAATERHLRDMRALVEHFLQADLQPRKSKEGRPHD